MITQKAQQFKNNDRKAYTLQDNGRKMHNDYEKLTENDTNKQNKKKDLISEMAFLMEFKNNM